MAAIQAGRLMLRQITVHVEKKQSFTFETTLSGLAYARHIPEWQALGYWVELFFLALLSAEMAVAHVAERVKQGGHNIPDRVIRRRFTSGQRHFDQVYRPLVDAWALYDNSGSLPMLLDAGVKP